MEAGFLYGLVWGLQCKDMTVFDGFRAALYAGYIVSIKEEKRKVFKPHCFSHREILKKGAPRDTRDT